MKNVDNPCLPKFYGFERFIFKNHTYLQIRMERLTKSGVTGTWCYALANLVREYSSQLSIDYMLNRFKAKHPKSLNGLIGLLGEEKFLHLMETLIKLYKIGDKKGWRLDLHNENFMLRGKMPVIVDPWVVPFAS